MEIHVYKVYIYNENLQAKYHYIAKDNPYRIEYAVTREGAILTWNQFW